MICLSMYIKCWWYADLCILNADLWYADLCILNADIKCWWYADLCILNADDMLIWSVY